MTYDEFYFKYLNASINNKHVDPAVFYVQFVKQYSLDLWQQLLAAKLDLDNLQITAEFIERNWHSGKDI